jgi:hypothetical protein
MAWAIRPPVGIEKLAKILLNSKMKLLDPRHANAQIHGDRSSAPGEAS